MKTKSSIIDEILLVLIIALILFLVGILSFSCNKKIITPNSVIITIDDAPNYDTNTNKMLDVLKKHKVSATFFCIGFYASNHETTMMRIHNEGHIIGNHTYNHPHLADKSLYDVFDKEIQKTQAIINKLQDSSIKYFRPPYGSLTNGQERYLLSKGYKTIWWNYDASDWNPEVSVKQIIDYHKDKIRNNTIDKTPVLLFHLSDNSIIALDSLLVWFKKEHIEIISL
jgi:peptidoglycan/xylan/chitin deacetylase (PgdA/CDA1 family)